MIRQKKMPAIANAVITSKKECCFKNIVDKMMLTHNSKETNFVFFFSRKHSLFVTAICTPREL